MSLAIVASATSAQSVPATLVLALSPTLSLETPAGPRNPHTDTPAPTATETLTPPPPPTNCPPPAGWVSIIVQMYDTLPGLAQTYRTSIEAIRQANCLVSDQLVAGSFLYIPPLPTATLVPCGAPASWVNYVVQPGDTLFSLSQLFRVSVAELQRANCLGGSTFIQAGKILKVPNVATSTPLHSATPSATFIVIKEETPTPTLTLPAPTTEVPSPTLVPPSDTPPAPENTPTATSTTPPTTTPTP